MEAQGGREKTSFPVDPDPLVLHNWETVIPLTQVGESGKS